MTAYATRQMRVPPSTLRAENRVLGAFPLAQTRALFTVLCAALGSATRTLSPISIRLKVADCVDRSGAGMWVSISIRPHYIHTFNIASARCVWSLKSVKSVFRYLPLLSYVPFLELMRNNNGLGEYGADRKSLTSMTTLIGEF